MEKLDRTKNPEADDERFGNFVAGQRALAAEQGQSLLDLAKERKGWKESDSDTAKEHIENYKKDIERLRTEIDAKKRSLISRIIDYKKINSLRKEMNRRETILAQRNETQRQRTELIEYYDKIIDDEERLGRVMEEAYKENADFDARKKAELIEEEGNRNVGNLIKKHQVFFVHDIIDADWKPSANNRAINTKNLDYEDQLDIVLGLDPTISVSTLSPDSKNRTFGKNSWGVFLAGGRILGGEESDAGTVGMDLRSRYIPEASRSAKAINRAIERPNGGGKKEGSYNELVMERPEVAGVYFKWGSDYLPQIKEGTDISLKEKINGSYLSDEWWETLENSMKTGAPIFVIDNDNNVRMVYDINIKARTIKVTPKYDPENFVDMPGIYKQHTDKSSKRAAITRVFDKVSHIIPEEERISHEKEKHESDGKFFYSVH